MHNQGLSYLSFFSSSIQSVSHPQEYRKSRTWSLLVLLMKIHWLSASVGLMPYLLPLIHSVLSGCSFDFHLTSIFISIFKLDSVLDTNGLHHLCLRFISHKECAVLAMKPDLCGRLLGSFPQNTWAFCGKQLLKIIATGCQGTSCNIPFSCNQIFIVLPLYL